MTLKKHWLMTGAAVVSFLCWLFLNPDKIARRHAAEDAEVLP